MNSEGQFDKSNESTQAETRPLTVPDGCSADSGSDPIWHEINDLRARIRKSERPWHKNTSTIIALLAFLLAVTTALLSEIRIRNQTVHNSRAELRHIITRLADVDKAAIRDASTIGSQELLDSMARTVVREKITLVAHAGEIISQLGDYVYVSEYLTVADASWQNDRALTDNLIASATRKASTPSQRSNALTLKARFEYSRGRLKSARIAYQEALDEYPIDGEQAEMDRAIAQRAYLEYEWAFQESLHGDPQLAEGHRTAVNEYLGKIQNEKYAGFLRLQLARMESAQRWQDYKLNQSWSEPEDPKKDRDRSNMVLALSQLLQEARRLYQKGALDECLEQYDEVIRQVKAKVSQEFDPVFARMLVAAFQDRAGVYFQRGHFQESAEDYRETKTLLSRLIKEIGIVELIPQHVVVKTYLAIAHMRLGDLVEALKELDSALLMQRDYAPASLHRGDVHKLLGETELAKQDWATALQNAQDPQTRIEAQKRLTEAQSQEADDVEQQPFPPDPGD